jgi:CRISPR-associated protein Csx10
LRIGDALLAAAIRERVAWALQRGDNPMSPDTVRAAFFDSRVQTKIDRVTGAPETDTLRSTRVVPRGTKLHAPLTALGDVDRPFLDLLLSLTRHVGLHRNRGMGHVRMSAAWDAPRARGESGSRPAAKGDMLHYRITLTAPCVFHADNLDPNSCSTLDHVPGSAIRGAVASALERMGDDEGIEALVAGGKAEFLNAYPEANGRRSVPTPCTWQHDKRADLDDGDGLAKSRPADAAGGLFLDGEMPATQRKPLDTKYVVPDVGEFIPVKPEIARRVHQTRVRRTGVSTANESTVYVYEALAPGQSFRGCIRAPQQHHARLRSVLEDSPLVLGKSARSGYGGAPTVEAIEPPFSEDELDRASLPSLDAGAVFQVWLLSPAIVRHPDTGQHDPWAVGAAVLARLRGKAALVAPCVRAGAAQGYIRQWRTELPAVPCAAAGSLLVMRATERMEAAEVAAAQGPPIGERVADGYGRIAICPMPPDSDGTLHVGTKRRERAADEPAGSPSEAELSAQRHLYAAVLQRGLTDLATALASPDFAKNLISPSLAQRLRTPLRSAGWAATYRDWFGDCDRALRQTALDPIKRCLINRTKLHQFISDVCKPQWTPPSGIAGVPDWQASKQECRIVPQTDADRIWSTLTSDLRGFFLERLLGQLARQAKRRRSVKTGEG